MRVHWIAACLLLSACAGRAFAEDPVEDRVDDAESLSEAYLEDSGETLLDLNTASLADLTALPHLTRRDAEKILAFRRAHGPYRSPAELTRIDGLPRPVVEAILPRVRANFAPAPEGGSRLRLMRRTGVDPSFLAGAGFRTRTTVRVPGLLDAAFTTDKDPEERRLADFAGGYVEVRPSARLRTVVGDFRPGFARGLVLSRWSRTPVGLEQVRRNPGGRVGSRSAEENGALRGVYLEGIGGPFRAAAFVSSARWDAARDAAGLVDRLMDGGLHVTATERSRKDALRERAVGLRLEGAGKGGWQRA